MAIKFSLKVKLILLFSTILFFVLAALFVSWDAFYSEALLIAYKIAPFFVVIPLE